MNTREILSHAKLISDLCERVNREKDLIVSTEGAEGYSMSSYAIHFAKRINFEAKK